MGKQQTLQTVITLSGKVDNEFGNIGEALLNIGNHVDALSQKIINFGKQDIRKFINYDDVMREVQALGDYTSSQRAQMDAYNQMIAQDSRFTMQQAAQADILVLTLPLTEQTHHLFGEEAFQKMKKGAILVNIARGGVVDTKALIQALQTHLGGAVLDVFEEEPLVESSALWDMEHVIATPHNSFVGDGNDRRLTGVIFQNLQNHR